MALAQDISVSSLLHSDGSVWNLESLNQFFHFEYSSKADEVWYKTVFWELLVSIKGLSCLDMLSWLAVNVKKSELEFVCMLLWGVWFNRNARSHALILRSPNEVVYWVSGLLTEFHSSHKIFILKNKAPMVLPPLAFSPPSTGELKLISNVGVGVVIRNDIGQVVVAMTKFVLGFFSAEMVELLALREGLLSAKNLGFIANWVEVDAANVASGLACDSFQWSDAGPIVIDIKGLFEDVRVVKCLSTPRNGNVMAYTLAALAFSYYWFNYFNLIYYYCPSACHQMTKVAFVA
ncbi:hypothetical protein LWI28_000226 [Acer negundo]|uniref:RNase H type-1 domain-containing protein n=1 Tax=Acer negundo TaxID=4023 RepID=A0AAD5I6V0_ACENE|nr:hypothetical protein LWI28_000226 [Acer negundo]